MSGRAWGSVHYEDLTLAELASGPGGTDANLLRALCARIERFEPECMEIVPAQLEALGEIDRSRFCLRVRSEAHACAYPGFARYALPSEQHRSYVSLWRPPAMNDLPQAPTMRMAGPDGLAIGTALARLIQYGRAMGGGVSLCPDDSRHMATANAVQWILAGGARFAAWAIGRLPRRWPLRSGCTGDSTATTA